METTNEKVARAKELYENKQAHEAVSIMRELILVEPKNESHRIQLALYLRAIGNFDESLFYVDKVSSSMSGHAMLKGWHLLRQGMWSEGMQMRESELSIYRAEELYRFPVEKRYTKGTLLQYKKVLLVLEGGNGDEIAYLRFAQTLTALGAEVHVAASREFGAIAKRTLCVTDVCTLETVNLSLYDHYIPAMSMFSLFDIKNPSEGITFPYIFPDQQMTSTWENIIRNTSEQKLKIGIQWQGNPTFDFVEFKTIPAELMTQFAQFGKLFLIQRPETIVSDNTFPSHVDAFNTQTEAPNWEQTLAVINAMDYVIAGDTTITHMAGALGKKAIVLLPHAPHPYWADLHDTSTWYPSITVCRQPSYNNWQGAVANATALLSERPGTVITPSTDQLLQEGQKYYEAHEYENALACIRGLYLQEYKNAQLQVFEAECLYYTKRADEAAVIMEKLHLDEPTNSNYTILLSQYLRAIGKFNESFTLLGEVTPSTPGYYSFLGWHLLQQGKIIEGFRTLHKEINTTDITHRYQLPLYKKLAEYNNVQGKRIFLVLDGGFGDQVLGVRFAKIIAEQGAQVIVGVTEPLLSVFKRIPFVTDVRLITEVGESEYDFYLSGIESIEIFKLSRPSEHIPFPYIVPDSSEIERLRSRMVVQDKLLQKIGVHWQGNLEFDSQEMKSIPAHLMLLLEEKGTLYSLQYDAGTNTLPEGNKVVELLTEPASWETTIAAMSLMDYIVTNDSSIAHIAGALGKKTAVVVPLDPSIYWLPLTTKNIWYPNILVFPQETYGNWEGAVNKVGVCIENDGNVNNKPMKQYSKEGQDIFVASLISKPGFYLDIGAAEPIRDNNTYLLETLGWNGILIDSNEVTAAQCNAERNAKSFCFDVEQINWKEFLQAQNVPKVIDYLSLDVDNSNIDVIRRFPFDEYQCKIITFETDFYSVGDQRKKICKEVLSNFPAYEYLLENVISGGLIFEDWIINKDYFPQEILLLKSHTLHWKEFLAKIQKAY